MSRIGFFGGSFDPVHLAHLALGRVAFAELKLDQLRWVPTGRPWHKQHQPGDAEHRVAMLELALDGEPHYVIDLSELRRDGPTYTLDTIVQWQAAEPGHEWFLIIGQDQYARFDTWHHWRELLERVTLAVAARDGIAPTPPPALAALPHRVRQLSLPRIELSSSAIRARAARGESLNGLVTPAVALYIERHHLYRDPPTEHAR